ncbi:uncharacterized protein LOC117652113 [Thrips palmi]|uniref:Uncharacterized protein LOC117652113 n=1 Tax=Thrips palmi TaxID=161013 RepID=A0A6P9A569_THRPL|nr:uncharacterized protein LOC117652113 [Thrips palmi]
MAAPRSSTLVVPALLLLTLLALSPGSRTEGAASTAKPQGGKGAAAMLRWMGREMPELAIKLVSCVKKSERDARDSIMSLFGDVAKCFDDAKGSVLYTAECMLKNGVPRILNVITVAHKVAACTVKNKKEGRLCVTVTNVNDEACPFAIGL